MWKVGLGSFPGHLGKCCGHFVTLGIFWTWNHTGSQHVAGAAVVTLCTVIAMLISECLAHRRRREAMEKAGVAKASIGVLEQGL